MSAFVVEDETINRVVDYIRQHRNENGPYMLQQLKLAGVDTDIETWDDELARHMFQLNVAAVDARYGDGEAAKFRALDFRSRFARPCSRIEVYKSLRCRLYQCSEGDVPESPLYQFLETEVLAAIAYDVISRLPDYDRAAWH